MRIAMLSAHSCPVGDVGAKDTGGMSVYIRELAGELGQQGHTVDVYTRTHDPKDPVIVELGGRSRLIHLKAGEEGHIHKLALYSYLPEFTCNLENFRKNDGAGYDIVFSHYWLSGWVGDYLKRWWGVPHAVMFHTLGALKNASGSGDDATELRIVTERETVQNSHRIIVATRREKEALVEHYGAAPEKIGVVPCGVNLETFRPVSRALARQKLGVNGETVLLYVGRIDPVKGIEQLLKAMPLLPKGENARLLLLGGDGRNRPEIEKLRGIAEELGIGGAVDFLGTVPQKQLPDYYCAADVCVLPSYYESFGLVALESLACGTPVVASDVGDLKNIIVPGKAGHVMPDNSPEMLAEGISRVLAGRNGSNGSPHDIRDSVADYDWARVSAEVIGELRKALALPADASYQR